MFRRVHIWVRGGNGREGKNDWVIGAIFGAKSKENFNEIVFLGTIISVILCKTTCCIENILNEEFYKRIFAEIYN